MKFGSRPAVKGQVIAMVGFNIQGAEIADDKPARLFQKAGKA